MNKSKAQTLRDHLKKLDFYLLMALFFSIPLFPAITTILLICYFIFKVPQFSKGYFSTLSRRKPLSFFMVLYLILLLGIIYTIDLENGLFKVQTQVSLFLVPFFMGGGILSVIQRNRLLLAYVFGVLFTILLCIVNLAYRILVTGKLYVLDSFSREQPLFFYKELSRFLDLHPTYFSIYLGVGLFCLLSISFKNTQRGKVLKGILIGLFFVFLFLTSSKGGIFSFVLVFTSYLIFESWEKKKSLNRKIVLALFLGTVIMIAINPLLLRRSSQLISSLNDKIFVGENLKESSNIRFNLWDLSLKTYKDSPVLGYGTGSVYKILEDRCLKHYSFSTCETIRLKNSHNQYLNFLVSNGVLALIPFVIALVLAFRTALKSKNRIFVLFMMFMALNFFFESILQRERGVVFFMLFVTMLIMSNDSYEKKKA